MAKKITCLILCLSLLLTMSGCWNYHGLNELTIAAGVAIDYDSQNSKYKLSFEIIDLSKKSSEGGVKAKIVESEGNTVFDAARNAKKRLLNKLYYGSMQIIILSKEYAEQEGVKGVLDWLLKDAECRETARIIISQGNTAKEILVLEGLDESVVSFEIQKIIDDDQHTTSSIKDIPLFKIYGITHSQGVSLTLPAFHVVTNDEKKAVETYGQTIFKGEKVIGFLDADESKYYLFATDGVHGGVLTISSDNKKDDITLEISKSSTKTSYSNENGKIKMKIGTDTDVYIDEMHTDIDVMEKKNIEKLETIAENKIAKNIADIISHVQTAYDSDIFGFGNLIYLKNPKLWQQIEKNWDDVFKTLKVEILSNVHIVNTAFTHKN